MVAWPWYAQMSSVTEPVQTSSTIDETDESEDDESGDKILETGGGGRWQKNNHKVFLNTSQQDIITSPCGCVWI